MKNTRPKFEIQRFLSTFIILTFLILLFGYFLFTSGDIETVIVLIILVVFSIGYVVLIIINHTESYIVEKGKIITKRGRKTAVLSIPKECILIISYADNGPGVILHNPARSIFGTIKGVYTVSIINSSNINELKDKIEKSLYRMLTPELIKGLFSSRYIYSFALDYEVLNELVLQTYCTILVPKEILTEIREHISMYIFEVY